MTTGEATVFDEVKISESVTIEIVAPSEILPAVEAPREVAYYYRDTNLPEACPVYEGHVDAWWMDGGVKLHELMAHFKKRHTVKQACYLAGISETQYKHFHSLHSWFVPVVRVYKSMVPMAISDVIIEAALGVPEVIDKETGKVLRKGTKPNAKIALGAARLYPNTETDSDFADIDTPLAIPPGGQKRSMVHEEIVDQTGKVVMSRRALELTENHDNGNSTS